MKRFIVLICFLLILGLTVGFGQKFWLSAAETKEIQGTKSLPKLELTKLPKEKAGAADPATRAKAVLLIDEKSGKILYQKNADLKVPIASTTKIMTAIVVLEDYSDKMTDTVTITPQMVNVEGAGMNLRVGEKITVQNLLKGMLIVSANEAAYSLAYYFGGLDKFVQEMNQKAAYLGLKNTSYKDPAGLNDEGYSTAKELGILATYALRKPAIAEIVRTPNASVSSVDSRIIHELKSSNRMLRTEENFYYPFAIGIKTGFTYAAGHCLVSAAEKDGHRIISVILNTDENTVTASAQESRKLLNWGLTNWSW